jgi:hypothetical protein
LPPSGSDRSISMGLHKVARILHKNATNVNGLAQGARGARGFGAG